jgi:predicted transcriptional regulator
MINGPLSAAKLAQAMGGEREKIQKVLDRLAESGVVLGEAGRKRPSYRLAPGFIREGLRLMRAESGGK